jgi:hypothetical protein
MRRDPNTGLISRWIIGTKSSEQSCSGRCTASGTQWRRCEHTAVEQSSTSVPRQRSSSAGFGPADRRHTTPQRPAFCTLRRRCVFLVETSIRVNCVVPHWIASPGPKEYFDSLTPEEREALGVPAELISLEEVAAAVLRLATDDALAGRALILCGGRKPQLIPIGDRGYASLEPLDERDTLS